MKPINKLKAAQATSARESVSGQYQTDVKRYASPNISSTSQATARVGYSNFGTDTTYEKKGYSGSLSSTRESYRSLNRTMNTRKP